MAATHPAYPPGAPHNCYSLRKLEPKLPAGGEQMGIVSKLLQPADEAFRAVRAVDDLRLDELDAANEVV